MIARRRMIYIAPGQVRGQRTVTIVTRETIRWAIEHHRRGSLRITRIESLSPSEARHERHDPAVPA